ncbi:hypothetical protein ACFL47_08240 [Candidatus Latescibacterota bacterium]
MEENILQNQIDDVNRKLDVIVAEMDAQRRLRNEISDLRDDLMRVGDDVFRASIIELEEFSDTLNTGDVLQLVKKIARNVNSLKTAFEQLESARDFVADVNSISGDMFNSVMLKLDELDRKGYFALIRESEKTLDAFASSFTADDLKLLNDSIPTLTGILKRLSNPELIEKLETAVTVFDEYQFDPETKVSTIGLVKEMTRPEVRKAALYMMGLMKNIVKAYESH